MQEEYYYNDTGLDRDKSDRKDQEKCSSKMSQMIDIEKGKE